MPRHVTGIQLPVAAPLCPLAGGGAVNASTGMSKGIVEAKLLLASSLAILAGDRSKLAVHRVFGGIFAHWLKLAA